MLKKAGKADYKKIKDIYLNVILIPITVWKFGPAVFHPIMFLKQPFSLLYFSGNNLYLSVGILLSVVYIFYRSRRDNIDLLVILDYIFLALMLFVMVSNLLLWKYGLPTSMPWGISIDNPDFKYHPINIYNLIMVLVIFTWFKLKSIELGKGIYFSKGLIGLGIGKMIISYFSFEKPVFLFLSLNQWLFLVLLLVGFLITYVPAIKNRLSNVNS